MSFSRQATCLWLITTSCLTGCAGNGPRVAPALPTPPQRLAALSDWYPLDDDQLQLYADYGGWDTRKQERQIHLQIHEQAKRMIREADGLVLANFFLFDNLYALDAPDAPAIDLVGELTDLLIERKKQNPDMPVVLVLDMLHKAWGRRISPAVNKLHEAGVDVFYSDTLDTRAASHLGLWEGINEVGRAMDLATAGATGHIAEFVGAIPAVPGAKLDGAPVTIATLSNAAYLKANHRKLLVCVRDGEYEALVTSWNPHNASSLHENHALAVKGELARYIYMVMRADVARSIRIGHRYTYWSNLEGEYRHTFLNRTLPPLDPGSYVPPQIPPDDPRPRASFATEQMIEPRLMEMLQDIGPGDEVRIQMFYLGRVPVIEAILDAAKRTDQPIRILLDPNREGINYAKDGTPNAQVAEYLMQRAEAENLNLEVRWYLTHGEQNHAKSMSITNPATGKFQMTVGSANWTRKNLGGINLEANLFVENAPNLNEQFNDLFDRLWYNNDQDVVYSTTWDDAEHNFHLHSGRGKWASQKHEWLFFPVTQSNGRPVLIEKEYVHW